MEKKFLTVDLVDQILKEANWQLEYFIEDDGFLGVEVFFKNSILSFSEDDFYGYVIKTGLSDKEQTFYRSLFELLDFFSLEYRIDRRKGIPFSEVKNDASVNAAKVMINGHLNFIKRHLMHVIEGDFSWKNDFLKYEADRTLIVTTLNRKYKIDEVFEHEIYQKFLHGDASWRIDLKNFEE